MAYLWLAVGLMLAAQLVVGMFGAGQQFRLFYLLVTNVAAWLDFLPATPLILYLARSYPLTGGSERKNLFIHAIVAIAIGAFHVLWYAVLQWLLNPFGAQPSASFPRVLFLAVMIQFHTGVIVYATIVAVQNMIRSAKELAQRETELTRAKLDALRRQLEPHFLFNTLNSISGLVRDNRQDEAVSMIAGLGDLLRRVLEDSEKQLVPLSDEVSFLERYVDLQSIRLGDRLKVTVEIPLQLSAALVPQLLLQPIIENAITHGVSKLAEGGVIKVTGQEVGGILSLRIYNDGPAYTQTNLADTSRIGLTNTRRRLTTLCGSQTSIDVFPCTEAGVETTIRLPFRTAV